MEISGRMLLALGVAIGGALVGALLPTLVYRFSVDWQAPLRSDCGACSAPLRSGPAGWVRLRARCVACGARTGPRTWLLAAITGAGCAGIVAHLAPSPTLVPFLLVIPLGCLLGAIDLGCLRLPEAIVLPAIGLSLALFTGVALITGQFSDLLRAVLGSVAFSAAYLVLALIPGGQLGLGDVTLGALLGSYLGWLGWPFVVLGILLPFIVHAPVVIWLLIVGRAGRKSELPFGPAILAGAYLTVVGPGLLRALLG